MADIAFASAGPLPAGRRSPGSDLPGPARDQRRGLGRPHEKYYETRLPAKPGTVLGLVALSSPGAVLAADRRRPVSADVRLACSLWREAGRSGGFRAPCQFGATCARHAVGPSQFAPDRGEEAVNNADSRFYEVRCDGEAAGILVCEEIAHAVS
ncbi:hypothetical protein [Streptomyces mirabilis]|uniref:hypothetical protein n=1 Tax=Streptomyces mirabilis TaxID=68239 RepID=UPI0033C653D0